MSAYTGISRRLVISFDIGTTFSGMSYCLLDPGQVPRICNITRYPGQEHAAGCAKVPTILLYNRQGRLCAAGAEALSGENVERVEDGELIKVEWFKVRMRPASMPSTLQLSNLPPLPSNRSLTQVFGDFLAYLMTCAERFIHDKHSSAERNWNELRASAVFVISHPNGWEGMQQSMLRDAAIIAKMVPDTPEGRAQVMFVTEGEASLHYCLREDVIQCDNMGFIIADLGGGTLDFSAYKLLGRHPLRVEEVSSSRCHLQGSTFVTMRAKDFIKNKLRDSRYGSEEHVKQIVEIFDGSTKKTFMQPSDICHVPFGSRLDEDLDHDVRSGKLRLPGKDVASFFKPSITACISGIFDLINEAPIDISAVYLVGGFSASPYVTSQLREHLARFDTKASIPDEQTAKAVADGALFFYIENYVVSRVAKMSFCMRVWRKYEKVQSEDRKKSSEIFTHPSGQKMVPGGLRTILKYGTSVTNDAEYRVNCFDEFTNLRDLDITTTDILAYRDCKAPPEWEDEIKDRALLKPICTIKGDTTTLRALIRPTVGRNRKKYWSYNYDVVLKCGGTELQAQIAWFENGVECRGPASIIYEELVDELANKGEPKAEEIDQLEETT